MRYLCLLALLLAGLVSPALAEPATSVTTTWLKDPFPNIAPKAYDRDAVVEKDTPARTPSALFGAYDVENDPLTVASFTQPAHGTTALNKDGTFTYRPRRGYVGADSFRFTLSDGRGGKGSATMHVQVVRPSGKWATTSFRNLAEVPGCDQAGCVVPRVVDWDGDGRLDLLVGAAGSVRLYRNTGTAREPRFADGVPVKAGGQEIRFGNERLALAVVDVNKDGRPDLVVVPAGDRKVRCYLDTARAGAPALAAPLVAKAQAGGDFTADDVRVEVADWNGDGLPDVLTGSFSGAAKVAYNVGTRSAPAFAPPVPALDADGRKIEGSYNLNLRVADLNQDGVPDLVSSWNWGNIDFHLNSGTAARPRLASGGSLGVSGPGGAGLDMHSLTDGPILDFADLDGDGTLDLVVGGEKGGKVRLALGQSGGAYLDEIWALIAAHPQNLGTWLDAPDNAAAKSRMQTLQGALYDYVVGFATPGQQAELRQGLLELIRTYPQYLKRQHLDLKLQPGIPSLAAQVWLTTLMTGYYDPAVRKELADAAGFTGGYRKLLEDIGLIYIENEENPRGAEAIWQWARTVPREIYPGTGITAADWLGGRTYLVRGHLKNTFNGAPVDRGEYGFGPDARAVIGDRGSENWFMTVVHHEACHDVDAYVRRNTDLTRRWGQTLVLAGGPDMRADPATGWLSWELTKAHFRDAGLWDGRPDTWDGAWKRYWQASPGKEWRSFGFMRGGVDWFYGAPQESLATQGNQFWNSGEGRLQVALDRWRRGYKSDLTEALFTMDLWSLGLNKMKLCENDNACNQVFRFVQLRRNAQGCIDRVDLGDRYYEFAVDDKGVVTGVVHAP